GAVAWLANEYPVRWRTFPMFWKRSSILKRDIQNALRPPDT
ncbi:MAG: hypothetical protein ACI9SG_001178, partial [Maribacter sp.]